MHELVLMLVYTRAEASMNHDKNIHVGIVRLLAMSIISSVLQKTLEKTKYIEIMKYVIDQLGIFGFWQYLFKVSIS